MNAPIRGLAAAAFLASSALVSSAAYAQTEPPSEIELSANATIATEYRFRGVSLSGGQMAVQAGFDAAHASGLYIGTWASSLEEDFGYGSTEGNIYGGFTTELTPGLALDVGMLLYFYADADDCNCDYWEPYASLSTALGPVEATLGVAYALDQASLDFGEDGGNDDNLYIYTDLGFGIPETPISFSAHLAYTDGSLSVDDDGDNFDWSIGGSVSVLGKFDVGVAYVGVGGSDVKNFTDDAIVGTLSASF